jgi:hypothetical protein
MMGFVSDLLSLRAAFMGVGLFATIVIVLAPAVVRLAVTPAQVPATPDGTELDVAPVVS